ncbi:MAG: HAMP domain-containing histidine kinase [Oscillospiraceae bacterium]|nr:HAMP domain-containing histidine kinase [Oscillospiraceae bacterium]
MKNYYRALFIIIILLAVGLIAVLKLTDTAGIASDNDDVLLLNGLSHRTAAGDIPTGDAYQGREYVILDANGNILYDNRTDKTESITVQTAMQMHYPYTYITENSRITGSIVITDSGRRFESLRTNIITAYCVCSVLFIAAALIFGAYIRRTLILPFVRMKDSASYVAAGDLDRPLEMDRDNIFGAFSESFDIMREELKASRARELSLQKKERELVASLSHDLKTPVTGIKLTSELMAAVFSQNEGQQITVTEDMTTKMNNIYKRADEINVLVNDLFSSALEDLGEFKVSCTDEDSSVIADIISRYDDKGLVRTEDIPQVIVRIDKLRLSQVIGNIISNSYKYAGTPIDISYRLDESFLEMTVSDSGEGVADDEIDLITNKFYRGRAHSDKEGSGLGLYIARILMDKMGGELSVISDNGLCVTLLIPLS